MDELLLVIITCLPLAWFSRVSRQEEHERAVRLLGLTTTSGQRFFEAIHAYSNGKLFHDSFRMSAQAFDELFKLCQPCISGSVRGQCELLGVALNWIGTAATCRAQEVLFDLSYSTVPKYITRGVKAIVQALNERLAITTAVLESFSSTHPYFDQALGAIDGTHLVIEISQDDIARFRNHKGYITTNVLIFCDWNMKVCFAHAGVDEVLMMLLSRNGVDYWRAYRMASTCWGKLATSLTRRYHA
ncbi:Nuclease HARBI1 [Phytophthora megakarya]|uniref:Nuclease HARBI1 n=1 Tax=Phytophthora megakarya TaxID=4795 RepID=A0A225WLW8_9STRA|nr:Nuclease HARBI1 [Phytophthora megakarya]